ncbi:DUF5131 family protein [Bosea sp. TWI1241]|uniref:DUF5131 family protein n=1 Tax=Bosea sp. TWI1241 TaxID=3148904 RepID=UPI003207D9E0
MGAFSAIEWCDHTANPWIGCQKVGPGCDHCYAEARDNRFEGGAHWGPGAPRRRTAPATRNAPLRWNRAAPAFHAGHGRWPRVFSGSLCDIFDNAVDPAWRKDHYQIVRETKNLRWILVTKRIGNAPAMLPEGWLDGGFDHVGIMITTVNQAEIDRDVPKLLDLPMTGNQWRGVSYEPALGPADFSRLKVVNRYGFGGSYDALRGLWRPGDDEGAAVAHPRATVLDWIVCGGESGDEARPMHPDWARAVRDQCAAAGTAFLFKQWGEWAPSTPEQAYANPRSGWRCFAGHPHVAKAHELYPENGAAFVERMGKKAAGRLLDGKLHHAFPRQLS